MKANRKRSLLQINVAEVTGILLLIISFTALIYFVYRYAYYMINSDDSSDLILSRLLAQEGKLVTSNWYYSTEIRLISHHIMQTLLFHFSDNWLLVRVGSTILNNIILLSAYYYFCAQTIGRRGFILTAFLLLCPYSFPYFRYVTFGQYYIIIIAISFIELGLFIKLCRDCGRSKKQRNLTYITFLLIGFLAGLNGVRQLLVLTIPLLMTMLHKNIGGGGI